MIINKPTNNCRKSFKSDKLILKRQQKLIDQKNYKTTALPGIIDFIKITEKISGKKFEEYPQWLKDLCYNPNPNGLECPLGLTLTPIFIFGPILLYKGLRKLLKKVF